MTDSRPFQGVDVSSPVPLYRQVADLIRRRIRSGEWPPATLIPGEPELCSLYEVSRVTIRQALALLVQEDLLIRRRGRGSFVREPRLTAGTVSVRSFSTELRELGMAPGSRILQSEIVAAKPEMAAAMNVDLDAELIQIRRLRTANGRPIGVQDTHLVANRFPGILDVLVDDASLYETIKTNYGVVANGANEVFEATTAGSAAATLLGCRASTPALHVVRVAFDETGVYEHTTSILHGERYQVRLSLHNHPSPKGSA